MTLLSGRSLRIIVLRAKTTSETMRVGIIGDALTQHRGQCDPVQAQVWEPELALPPWPMDVFIFDPSTVEPHSDKILLRLSTLQSRVLLYTLSRY